MSLLKMTFNHLSHQKLLKMQVMFQKAVDTATKDQEAKHSELETVETSLHTRLYAAGALDSGMMAILPQAVVCNLKKSFLAKTVMCNLQQS